MKKRIALPGRGKRGGARTIVATNHEDRWFFLLGFAKNERADFEKAELKALQELASLYLSLDQAELSLATESGKLVEICHGGEET